jgi:glyoxylase I family protein
MTDNITNIHHSSLLVADTQTSLQFYTEVLGLKQIERPNLPFPGAWMAVGDQQIHILELDNPDPTTGRPAHGGRDRHIAFNIINLDQLKHNLESHQVPYTLSISGRKALFCRDPDGNALEFIEQQ